MERAARCQPQDETSRIWLFVGTAFDVFTVVDRFADIGNGDSPLVHLEHRVYPEAKDSHSARLGDLGPLTN